MQFVTPDTEVDTYEHLVNRLVMESIATASVFDIFRRLIPKASDLLQHLRPTLTQFSEASNLPFEHVAFRESLKIAERHNFMSYQDMLVMVPEGFTGKMLPYLQVLTSQGNQLFFKADVFLRDYITELTVFLSNADIRLSQKSHAALFKQIEKERVTHQKALESYYNKNSTLSRQPLGKVIDRFSDLALLYKETEALINVRKRNDYQRILQQVEQASDLLGLIKQRVDSQDITKLSAPAAKNIAEGAYQVASFVEYLAFHAYATETAIKTVLELSNHLKKVLK